jgi:hypothetical protein
MLFFIFLAWYPLVLAQEGDTLPEPESMPPSVVQPILDTVTEEQQPVMEEQQPVMEEQDPIIGEMEQVYVQEQVQEQDPERPLVQYTSDFEFRDGLFVNFETVKSNNPIPPARIVTDEDMFDRAFYDKITSHKEITIYDENGVKKVLLTEDIWGYSRNGILYINVGVSFHRISFMGSISHFVATVTTYSPSHYDPYYYNPYYSNSYYYNRYSMPQSTATSTDLRQYLLDFETGDVMEYDVESVEVLLMKDPELADEYHALRTRKQKQMKFVYIRRFNEKHPLYFPADY